MVQPRRHRLCKPARLDSARVWVRSGARVTVKTYAKWYGVDRPSVPREERRPVDELDDPDRVWVGDRRMFVVGYTAGGAPFGCWEDEFDDGQFTDSHD